MLRFSSIYEIPFIWPKHVINSFYHFLTLSLWSLWALRKLFSRLRECYFPVPWPHPKISWSLTSVSFFLFGPLTLLHVYTSTMDHFQPLISSASIYGLLMQLLKSKQLWRLCFPKCVASSHSCSLNPQCSEIPSQSPPSSPSVIFPNCHHSPRVSKSHLSVIELCFLFILLKIPNLPPSFST